MQRMHLKGNIKMLALYKKACFVLAICCFMLLLAPISARAIPAEDVNSQHYATSSFTSHMPVLVLDVKDDDEPEDSTGYFLPANISVFEGEPENSLNKTPTFSASASLRNMADKENGVNPAYKSDYYLRLDEKESLMGLGTTSEYLLLGGAKDKSLLRNYLGYTLGDTIANTKATSQLCEVFFRTADGDLYQGVYLVVALSLPENSFLFHRSVEEEGIVIETYAMQNGFSDEFISIPFMQSTAWDDAYGEIIGEFSIAESILYSTESSEFYKYIDRYDVQSFIESFLLGELTQNYAEMDDAYYYYDPNTKRVAVAPIYNFETAFDNERNTYANPDQIKYQEAPYYAQLFRSPQFAGQVQAFYLRARNVGLSETDILALVDEAAAYVAPVVARDWARWNAYSSYVLQPVTELVSEDDEVTVLAAPFKRATATYEQELLRIRYGLRTHNLTTSLELTQFDFNEQEISREIVLNTNPIWVVVFIVGLFAAIHFARRYGE